MLQKFPKIKELVKVIGKECFRIESVNRYLYINSLYFPKLLFRKNFLKDNCRNLFRIGSIAKARMVHSAIILGNAECLNQITREQVDQLRKSGFLVIGLNRSIYKLDSDIQIWSDIPTMIDIIENGYLRKDCIFLKVTIDNSKQIKESAEFWYKHKSFQNWTHNRLFQLRTVLTAAYHLCYKLDISNIYLAGVDLETRNYFYRNNNFNGTEPYEQQPKESLKKSCCGYTTQEIVKEITEYLCEKEQVSIHSLHKNKYLQTIQGLKFTTIDKLNKEFDRRI